MALYFTDFSEYTTGQQPADWTKRFVANFSWLVQADAGVAGGKILQSSTASGSARNGLSWDVIDADANRANVEILFKARFNGTLSSSELMSLIRGSGGAGTETAYRHGARPSTGNFEGAQYLGGSFSTLSNTGFSYTSNEWYNCRVRVNGSSQKIKVWSDTGLEPASWGIETTSTSITGVGWVGLLRFQAGPVDISTFGVGTNGDTAPTGPATPTPINLGAINILTTSARLTWEQG